MGAFIRVSCQTERHRLTDRDTAPEGHCKAGQKNSTCVDHWFHRNAIGQTMKRDTGAHRQSLSNKTRARMQPHARKDCGRSLRRRGRKQIALPKGKPSLHAAKETEGSPERSDRSVRKGRHAAQPASSHTCSSFSQASTKGATANKGATKLPGGRYRAWGL